MTTLRGFLGAVLVMAVLATMVPNQALASYAIGNKICVESQTIPGHYVTTKFWDFVGNVGSGLGGWAIGVAAGASWVGAGLAAAGTWVLKELATWVPTTTICLRWEPAGALTGNEYQF